MSEPKTKPKWVVSGHPFADGMYGIFTDENYPIAMRLTKEHADLIVTVVNLYEEMKEALHKVVRCGFPMKTTPGMRFSFRIDSKTFARWKELAE